MSIVLFYLDKTDREKARLGNEQVGFGTVLGIRYAHCLYLSNTIRSVHAGLLDSHCSHFAHRRTWIFDSWVLQNQREHTKLSRLYHREN